MATREYYTVDRSPQEVRNLWDWAIKECKGKVEHEKPYAMGVLAAMEYLMGETEELPQDYKGKFTLDNVLRQTQELAHRTAGTLQPEGNELVHCCLKSSRPGNPKTFLYGDPDGCEEKEDGNVRH